MKFIRDWAVERKEAYQQSGGDLFEREGGDVLFW